MRAILRLAAMNLLFVCLPCFAQTINSCVSAEAFKTFQEKEDAPLLIKAENVRPTSSQGMKAAMEIVTVGGVRMPRADAMASKYAVAKRAEESADQAIARGDIKSSERGKFIATVKRLLYLDFTESGYVAGWVGMAYSRTTGKGVLVSRNYQITEKGDVLNNGKICFMDTLVNVRYLVDDDVTAKKIAEENKASDCDAQVRDMGYGCGSLHDALIEAYSHRQGLIALAQSSSAPSVRYVMTGRPEFGSLYIVSRQGTANKINSLFEIKIDQSLLKQ